MIGLGFPYVLAGLMFGAFALVSARDATNPKRWRNTAFWSVLSASFLFGDLFGDFANGLLVLGLAAIAGLGGLGRGEPVTTSPAERTTLAERHGDRLVLLVLIVPAVALVGALGLKEVRIGAQPLLETKQAAVISLALGVLMAMVAALIVLRPKPSAPVQEGRRLADLVGWAIVLPQALAALGAVFALGGVGAAVGQLVDHYAPLNTPVLAVIGYTLGMAILTALMGNAFAAFPVITAAIGLPLIVHKFHGNPAIMGALGMLAGFSGTLVTPMAANFNLVPVSLLELPDRWAVIRAQAPTALAMLIVNAGLMYALVYRF